MTVQASDILPRWLKISQASKYANLSPKTLKRMLIDGQLKGERTPGGHWRVDRESIDEYFTPTHKKAIEILRSLEL